MPLWGNLDLANNAPKFAPAGGYGVSANGYSMFANTAINGFTPDTATGVFGVSAAEKSNTSLDLSYAQHAGWNLRRAGTGPVTAIAVANGGSGFLPNANGFIAFTGYGSGANARYYTNGTGNVNSVVLLSGGADYNVAPTAAVTPPNVANVAPTFTVTVGGRAGRIQYETLVAGNVA